MAIYTTFPNTFEQFIEQYVIEEEDSIEVVPLFRVKQGWKHYTNEIDSNIKNIWENIFTIIENLGEIQDRIEK